MTTRNPPTFGVIFDMDGVLVDSADAHFQSWHQLGTEQDVNITRDQFSRTFGRQNRDIIPLLFGPTDHDRLARLADRKEEIYRELVRASPPIVPNARKLVHDLHRLGAALAIGSSGPIANINLILDALDATPLMTAVVSGDDVTRGKPDPQVFQLAAEKINLPPGRCVVVEDAPVGVDAARSARCKSVAVLLHHPATAFDSPDLAVNALADLTAETLRSISLG